MYAIHAEYIKEVGPDGQTQDWNMAYYTKKEDAELVAEALNQEFKGIFKFYAWEDEPPPLDPTLQELIEGLYWNSQ